jgi:DNA helicase-2/ATP-dependent DNA helicase PcrA
VPSRKLRAVNPPPPALGRSVVVAAGGTVPDPWRRCPRFTVEAATLEDASRLSSLVDRLHRAWVGRDPVVVELAVDAAAVRKPERTSMDPWRLRRGFLFDRERLHHLTWANSYDARTGDIIWWWGRKAEALGFAADGVADIRLVDGRPAWVDGGPRGPVLGPDDVVVHAESVTLGRAAVAPPPADAALRGLAPDQRSAAGHGSGPARIIAPAGSGKTRTLTAHIRHLVADRGVEPELICALAYNNRAAAEMRQRLGAHPDLAVRTLHSLGWEILRDAHGPLTLLDERGQRRRLDGMVEAPRRPNADIIGPYLEALGEVRVGLRPPDDVGAFRDDVPGFAGLFDKYRRLLRERREADFDEQIYGAVEALLGDSNLRHRWQDRCRHVVVDEFQDLTPAYVLLIRLLAAPELNVFGVGDDDQVIYGYLGADPGFLIDYDGLFPGAASHPLEVNYRCPPAVVEAAHTLLGHNRRRVDKTIRPHPERADAGGLDIELHPGTELALQCAVHIAGWLETTTTGEIAVLARVNSSLLPVHVALAEAGIPFRSPLRVEVLERTVMAAALAWIRIGLDPEAISTSDLMKVVRRPARGLTRLTGQLVGRRRRVSLEDLRGLGSRLEGSQADKWDGFCADIERAVATAARGDSIRMLDVINREIGLDSAAAALDAGRRRADRSAQSDDLVALRRAAVLHRDLKDFESWLRVSLSQGSNGEGVELSTVHRVKGMEWDRVVVFGADNRLFPHELAEDREEERRVFHVAITRGKSEVVVFADEAEPSPFIEELSIAVTPARSADFVRPSARSTGVVVAVGDRLRISGGYTGVVRRFEDGGVMVAVDGGGSEMLVEWGETVTSPAGSGPLSPTPEPVAADGELVERLKTWRRNTAVANAVPAYIVMNDRTLMAIATVRPETERELILIPGIGPAKLEAYGDEILAICAGLG